MSGGHDDFATEPVRGLPENLPEGETILWQGAPAWRSLAVNAFHVRSVAVYFLALMIWRATTVLSDGGDVQMAAIAAAALLPLAALAIGLLAMIAYLYARTTVYTITNRRVVLRIGVALTKAINVPYNVIASAAVTTRRDGGGDIPLTIKAPDRIVYLHLWPHVRPWRFRSPEPMLRAIPDVGNAAAILANALRQADGQTATVTAAGLASRAPKEKISPTTGGLAHPSGAIA